MKIFNFILISVFAFSFILLSQEKNLDDSTIKDTSVEYIVKKIEMIEEEIKEMKDEIKDIKEFNSNIRKTIRNLQLYVQPASTLPPAEEDWKSIKSGMYKEDVENILGKPEEIEKKRTGEEIWYYYRRGSIKFDRRGKVVYIKDSKDFPPYFPANF